MKNDCMTVVVCVIVSCACLYQAKTVRISKASDFSKITSGDDVILTKDIDAKDSSFAPVGGNNFLSITFDGQNNTIRNINIMSTNGKVGLFFKMKDSVVKNLIISSSSFSGSEVGGLIVNAAGNITIKNVIIKANISGNNIASGFIGQIDGNYDASISYEDCMFDGTITMPDSLISDSVAGAFIGGSSPGVQELVIAMSNCTNNGKIILIKDKEDSTSIGGMAGFLRSEGNLTVVAKDCVNNGMISLATNFSSISLTVGGFFAMIKCNTVLRTEMMNNVNNGNIVIAGLAMNSKRDWLAHKNGRSHNSKAALGRKVDNSHNLIMRSPKTTVIVGGLVGSFVLPKINFVVIENIISNGNINSTYLTTDENTEYVGGLIGKIECETGNSELLLKKSINRGNVSGNGISTNGNDLCVSGCVGRFQGNSNSLLIMNHSVNEGIVHGSSISDSSYASGLIGCTSGKVHLTNCENDGSVEDSNHVCGLICGSDSGTSTITNSVNKGNLTGNNTYGIAQTIQYAFNVISLGTIECFSSAYSISKELENAGNYYYVLKDNCKQCHDSDSGLMTFQQSGGFYYVSHGERMDITLNDNIVQSELYCSLWTPELTFYDENTCLVVVTVNAKSTIEQVECGIRIDETKVVCELIQNEEVLVVYDALNESSRIGLDTRVAFYSHILVNNVTGKPYIEIEIPQTDKEKVTRLEVVDAVNDLLGTGKHDVVVDIKDEEGVLLVVVYLDTIEEAKAVADSIKECSVEL